MKKMLKISLCLAERIEDIAIARMLLMQNPRRTEFTMLHCIFKYLIYPFTETYNAAGAKPPLSHILIGTSSKGYNQSVN